MNIKEIHVENIRGITSVRVTNVAETCIVLGWNRQGKSSLLDAVRLALFAECRGHDGKRLKNDYLVRNGARCGSVNLLIEHDGREYACAYTVNKKGQQSIEWQIDGKPQPPLPPVKACARAWGWFGARPEHAACAANPRAFLLGDELPELLGGLAGGLTDEAFSDFCGDRIGWVREFCADCSVQVRSFDDIAALGKRAAEQQTVLNRTIKEQRARLDALPAPTKTADTGAVRAQLDTLRKQRDSIQREIGRVSSGRTADEIEADKQSCSARIEACRAAHEVSIRESDGNDYKGLQSKHAAAVYAQNTAMRALEVARRNAAKVMPDACPACLRPFTDDDVTNWSTGLSNAVHEAEIALDDANANAQTALTALQTARDIHERFLATQSELNAAEAYMANLNTEQPRSESVENLEQEIAVLDTRISKGEQILESASVADERAMLERHISSNEAEIENLKWAIDAFRDGAAVNALAGGGRELFIAQVNAVLAPFGESIECLTEGADLVLTMGGIPVRQVSTGMLLILQLAIGRAFGQNAITIIDELGELDARWKSVWFSQSVPGNLLCAGPWNQPQKPVLAALREKFGERTSVVWMEDGRNE